LRPYTGAASLHEGCHPTWLLSRRAQAIAALAAIGIRPPWHDSAEGWRKYSEERVGYYERNCGLSRAEAESEACKDCVNTWLDLNVPYSPNDVCLHCGADEQPNTLCSPMATS
jgi:hypothetical protein